ncbi:MAG TPA: hypothetical protein VJ813_02120 [Vicinamibacterales bacterium]|nr:hypothetical protein [Vicinamibacterales bacterium]
MATGAVLAGCLLAGGAGAAAQPASAPAPAVPLTLVTDAYPTASPDGARIAFQSNRTGRFELFIANADGSGRRQLTNRPDDNVSPVWSPAGTQIAFSGNEGARVDIYVINVDGTGLRRLTTAAADNSHPSWSADGTRIFFSSNFETPDPALDWSRQHHDIYSIGPDGSGLRRHTRCEAVCTYPSPSPDGRWIAYRKIVTTPGFNWDLSSASRNSEVFIARIDGSEERNLSNSAAFDGWPAWSPDGARIAYASNRAGPINTGHIYVVTVDGKQIVQATGGTWSHSQPRWTPDGKSLLVYRHLEQDGTEFGHIARVPLPVTPRMASSF